MYGHFLFDFAALFVDEHAQDQVVLLQILINVVWMLLSPPVAVHMYPTREDNVLVCSSHKDASYMIAFGYPIMLILVCTVYAVLTRKIPGAFNESQHIGKTSRDSKLLGDL